MFDRNDEKESYTPKILFAFASNNAIKLQHLEHMCNISLPL